MAYTRKKTTGRKGTKRASPKSSQFRTKPVRSKVRKAKASAPKKFTRRELAKYVQAHTELKGLSIQFPLEEE